MISNLLAAGFSSAIRLLTGARALWRTASTTATTSATAISS